jgi:hypothetical protein
MALFLAQYWIKLMNINSFMKLLFKKEIGCGVMEMIHLAQDRGKWWAPVNTLLNLQVP